MALLYSSGLRLAEALALRLHDVDLDAGVVHVRRGKGGKSRRSGMFRFGEPHVRAWLARRAQLGVGELAPSSAPWTGDRSDRPTSDTSCRAWAGRPGSRSASTPTASGTRHAAELDKAGVRLTHISEQLGHARPSTTDTYLTRIGSAGLVEAIQGVA